jgi:hypothetical protein
MKLFTHNPILFNNIKTEESCDGRYYLAPNGRYPSITTLLGQDTESKLAIQNWQERIGLEEAKKISDYACTLGSDLHSTVEKYLNNDKDFMKGVMVQTKYMFTSIQPYLNKIDNIVCQEAALYSDVLKIAGRTDCVAEYDGKLSIIDFKTSRREKLKENITKYFVQGTAYSLMLEEMTGLVASNIVIIMSQYDAKPLIFEVNRKYYYRELKRYIDEYLGELLGL